MLGNGARARWRVAEQIGATDQALFGPKVDQQQRHRPNDRGACPKCKGQRDANGTGAHVAWGPTCCSAGRWSGHATISWVTTSKGKSGDPAGRRSLLESFDMCIGELQRVAGDARLARLLQHE